MRFFTFVPFCDIENGAMASIQGARGTESIGNIVLSSTGGINGGEFAANGLYTVAKDGNNLKITGINPNGGGGEFGDAGIISSGNSGAAWGLVDSIIHGTIAAEGDLKGKLSDAVNNIIARAARDPAAYSAGRVKNNEGYTNTDVDTFNAGLYASYNHPTGFFVDANTDLGMAWNDTATTDALSGGSRTGSYRNTSFQLGASVGYSFALPAEARIIPSLGLQWTNVRQQGWTESVQSPTQLANWFGRSTDNYLSLPLQVRMNKTFHLGGDASITPELRAAWVFEAIDPQTKVRMGYVGSNASTTLAGLSSGRSRGIIGAGVKAKFTRNIDAFVDYNLEFRNKYQNHNVMAGLGVSF